jgi:hypothetical protein
MEFGERTQGLQKTWMMKCIILCAAFCCRLEHQATGIQLTGSIYGPGIKNTISIQTTSRTFARIQVVHIPSWQKWSSINQSAGATVAHRTSSRSSNQSSCRLLDHSMGMKQCKRWDAEIMECFAVVEGPRRTRRMRSPRWATVEMQSRHTHKAIWNTTLVIHGARDVRTYSSR